jgi:alkyldihydroxyacetonephosphate synthase
MIQHEDHDELFPADLCDQELDDLFCQVTALVGGDSTTTSTSTTTSDEEKLRLYGLYKLVHDGPCCGDNNGNDDDTTNNIPSIFQPVARSKFLAWKDCSSLFASRRQDAMKEYIRIVSSRQDKLGKECRRLLLLTRKGADKKDDGEEDDDINRKKIEQKIVSRRSYYSAAKPNNTTTIYSTYCDGIVKSMGVRPLVPRGRLDISYRDLAFALHQCTIAASRQHQSRREYDRLKDQIGHLWVEAFNKEANPDIAGSVSSGSGNDNKNKCASDNVVVGLSVRSLFDIYLTMKGYPDNSEILVVPPINVPGMMHVARYHNLRIIPVDIIPPTSASAGTAEKKEDNHDDDDDRCNNKNNHHSMWIDVEGLKSKVTDNTVAILVVHPFGIVTADPDTMDKLRRVADNHRLELWEDCAECFIGLGSGEKVAVGSDELGGSLKSTSITDEESSLACYVGSSAHVDVRFFSFGTIKTATALGGGIALLRNSEASKRMERLQQSLYTKQQTHREYFYRIITAFILNFIADSPLRVGILSKLCQLCGLSFDTVVTYAVRGFYVPNTAVGLSSSTKNNPKKKKESEDRWIQSNLVRQIRKKPSCALLAVLHRRLEQSKRMAPSVSARIQRCKRIEYMLQQELPEVLLPDFGGSSINTFWAFPILCENKRDLVSRDMQYCGFDVASGASQLCSLSKFTDDTTNQQHQCPYTDNLMNSILYLPICSQQLSESTLVDLIDRLKDALKSPPLSYPKRLRLEDTKIKTKRPWFIFPPVLILLVVLMVVSIGPWAGFEPLTRGIYYIIVISSKLFVTFVAVRLCAECLLRWTTAEFYLKESSAFAENCDMIDAKCEPSCDNELSIDTIETQRQGVLSNMQSLKLSIPSNANDILSRRKVIVTGATGFVGSSLLRDLLLHRHILSLETIIVVCRKKGALSAETRIKKMLDRPMFMFLSEEEKSTMIQVMEGDVTIQSAGLFPADLAQIVQDVTISHVFHCAAAVSFTLELPNAAQCNITSALNMQAMTGRLKDKEARFVHVSTAFVHGDKTGSTDVPLPEELFDFDSFDPIEIYRSMLGTQYYASKAMTELGFPNTYSFSKSVCEHLLSQSEDVDTVIIRPSIVGPAIETPFEGWAGDRPSTIVAGPCLHLSHQWNIWHLGRQHVACIPVDVLARFILAKSFSEKSHQKVSAIDGNSSSDGSYERISHITSDDYSEGDDTGSAASSQDAIPVAYQFPMIHNATWNTGSDQNSSFSWLEFSVAYLHLGSILGYFSRSNAMMQLFISAQLIPSISPTNEMFDKLQTIFIRSPFQLAAALYDYMGLPRSQLTRLLAFLDLPLLFYPFVKNEFHFHSDLVASKCFNVKRYSFSCGVAAHRFISSSRTSSQEAISDTTGMLKKMACFAIGGRNHSHGSSYFWWAFSQPRGDLLVRVVAALVGFLLWMISTVVTVDINSFRKHLLAVRSEKNGPVHLILVPTHRSFLDFILLSYVFFSLPELQVDLPFIIAADEFEQLPVIGWLARRLRAFYIERGKGRIDSTLSKKLKSLKGRYIGATFEVFIEGRRSRDRRFVNPKTGLLKSMKMSGGSHVILPITINYECIPEQNILSEEAAGTNRRMLSVAGMICWLKAAMRGEINIGKIHIAANDPIPLDCESDADFQRLVDDVQLKQQKNIFVSEYHVRAASNMFDVKDATMKNAMTRLGCRFWPDTGITDLPELPTDSTSLLTIVLHFGHILAPLFFENQRIWCVWLNRVCNSSIQETDILDSDIRPLYDLLYVYFQSADEAVEDAILKLRNKGFSEPNIGHVFQTSKAIIKIDVPLPILHAAVLMKFPSLKEQVSPLSYIPLDIPHANLCVSDEKLGFWGFNDSGFIAKTDNRGRRYVTMKGTRYALCGKPMSKILPFMESALQVKIDLSKEFNTTHPTWCSDVKSDICTTDQNYLENIVEGRISFSTLDRARHGTGHSQEDVFALRNGENIRIPDAVLWPCSEQQVVALVNAARLKGWCIIPYGGGTNVIEATRCPTRQVEPRPILSVSMKYMNHILWLNEEDGLAHVEAGITGRELTEILDRRGYTMGHEPDSIEFSTLGGWIATKASGMKRSKYGNIEDIVVSARVVSPDGVLWKGSSDHHIVSGRHSEGMDVRTFAFGSEGCLGIITSAVIRVWPLPEVRKFDSVMFPRFEDGLHFLRSLSRERRMTPSCVRLLDNAHFRLGQALRPDEPTWFHQAKDTLVKAMASFYLTKDFSPDSVVCATINYEGSDREVREQMATVKKLSGMYGGIMLGSRVGKSGYELTYMIAYLRDFAMTYHILGESFETFVQWSKIETLIAATKERIIAEHTSLLLPGVPFIGCRVTQLYHEGACLYFYLCMSFENVDRASAIFADLERAARDEILKQGGSLSHHHGLGKLRSSFAKDRSSPEFQNVVASIKDSIDKDNIFGARNGLYAP